MGAERTEIPLPVKGTGRAHTELKKTVCARTVPQRDLWERSGQKYLCWLRVRGGHIRYFK